MMLKALGINYIKSAHMSEGGWETSLEKVTQDQRSLIQTGLLSRILVPLILEDGPSDGFHYHAKQEQGRTRLFFR